MTTDPLSAQTPQALFGAAAVGDLRRLKRAYAKLIRVFSPESAPDVFAHVRRLYEEARAALQRGAAAVDGEGEGPPRAVVDLGALLGMDRASLEAGGWSLVVSRLYEQGGRAPEMALDAAIAALPEGARADARGALLAGLCHLDPQRAAETWRRWQSRADHTLPVQARVLQMALADLRWHLAPVELDRLVDALRRADHPFDDGLVDQATDLLYAARAVRGAHRVPAAVLDIIRTGHGAPPVEAARALRRLVECDVDLDGALALLERGHPGLYAALWQMYEEASDQRAYLWAWAYRGEPPDMPDQAQVDTVIRTSLRAPDVSPPASGRGLRILSRLMYVGAVLMLGAAIKAPVVGLATVALLAVGGWWIGRHAGAAELHSDMHHALNWPRMTSECAAAGVWPHELVAGVWTIGDPRARAAQVEPGLNDLVWLIAQMTPAHIRRLERLERRAAAEAEQLEAQGRSGGTGR